MITMGGKEWISTADEIYYGNRKIQEVYYGNKKVYPDYAFLYPTLYFVIDEKKIEPPSKFEGTIVNQIGIYIKEPEAFENTDKIYKTAFYIKIIDNELFLDVLVSLYGFASLSSDDVKIIANGFYANNKNIISTVENDPEFYWIKNQILYKFTTDDEKIYYRRNDVYAIPEEIQVKTKEWDCEKAKIFENEDEALNYILS